MRVNHVGEVCAQALYASQAWGTNDPYLKAQFDAAAREETDHLAWTRARLDALGARLLATADRVTAWPTASALLLLAPAALAAGPAHAAADALPLYIRDKVAQTTDERMQIKAQQAAAL